MLLRPEVGHSPWWWSSIDGYRGRQCDHPRRAWRYDSRVIRVSWEPPPLSREPPLDAFRTSAQSGGKSREKWRKTREAQVLADENIIDVAWCCSNLERICIAWPKSLVWEQSEKMISLITLVTSPEINPRNRKNKRVRLVPGIIFLNRSVQGGPRKSKSLNWLPASGVYEQRNQTIWSTCSQAQLAVTKLTKWQVKSVGSGEADV